jgi:hypothetical protein
MTTRVYRAGQSVEDYCRACHVDRIHTVVVVDGDGHPLRVTCDFCRSEHNFRGGGRTAVPGAPAGGGRRRAPPAPRRPPPVRAVGPAARERARDLGARHE